MDRNELERRLALASVHLGWSPDRLNSFREGYEAANPDAGRTHLHHQDDGYDEGSLSREKLDSLAYRDGARARAAADLPAQDLGSDAEALVAEAQGWADNAEEPFDPEDAEWAFSPAGDMHRFLGVMGRDEWVSWFEGEHRDAVDDGRPGYGDLLVQDILDAVVFLEHPDGRVEIWDGWHRIGASVTRGSEAIPVLVGRPREPVPAP